MTRGRPAADEPLEVSPLAAVLRAYSYAYTAAHRLDLVAELMTDGYELRMGPHLLAGRDEAYLPAARRQFDTYPGLGFTVHDLISNGDRAALVFTEHGRSARTGTVAAWRGVSLYRWNGRVLTECRVEQDYHSRADQLRSGDAAPVPAPHPDPWTSAVAAPSAPVQLQLGSWLGDGRWWTSDLQVDDGGPRFPIAEATTTVLDSFSAGDAAAFHVRVDGVCDGPEHRGSPMALFATGLVRLSGGDFHGQVVTDRWSAARRLDACG